MIIDLTTVRGNADEVREDNIVFRVHPEGSWSDGATVLQEHACIARLCAPGKIIIESRFCFSIRPYTGPSISIGGIYDASCSPGRVPPGHYVATVDGLPLEFDIPRRYSDVEWPRARRDDVHPRAARQPAPLAVMAWSRSVPGQAHAPRQPFARPAQELLAPAGAVWLLDFLGPPLPDGWQARGPAHGQSGTIVVVGA
jgi:hypothetical protein